MERTHARRMIAQVVAVTIASTLALTLFYIATASDLVVKFPPSGWSTPTGNFSHGSSCGGQQFTWIHTGAVHVDADQSGETLVADHVSGYNGATVPHLAGRYWQPTYIYNTSNTVGPLGLASQVSYYSANPIGFSDESFDWPFFQDPVVVEQRHSGFQGSCQSYSYLELWN